MSSLRHTSFFIVIPIYLHYNTVYTHPTSSGNKHIPSGGSAGQILRWSSDGTAVWGSDNNTTYSTGTSSASGLTKLYGGTGNATDGTMTQSAITYAIWMQDYEYTAKPAFMNASQSITLNTPVSKTKNGIVLVWSEIDAAASTDPKNPVAANSGNSCFFIPKKAVELCPGQGFIFHIVNPFDVSRTMTKYVYISDTTIKGNNLNETSGTNSKWVLKAVIAV